MSNKIQPKSDVETDWKICQHSTKNAMLVMNLLLDRSNKISLTLKLSPSWCDGLITSELVLCFCGEAFVSRKWCHFFTWAVMYMWLRWKAPLNLSSKKFTTMTCYNPIKMQLFKKMWCSVQKLESKVFYSAPQSKNPVCASIKHSGCFHKHQISE